LSSASKDVSKNASAAKNGRLPTSNRVFNSVVFRPFLAPVFVILVLKYLRTGHLLHPGQPPRL
jgi:hypothetical protein